MTTPENNNNPLVPETTKNSSMLDQIIQTARESNSTNESITNNPTNTTDGNASWVNNTAPLPPKKPRDPVTAGTVIKMIGSLLLVSIIFFWSFVAYIAFNPNEAVSIMNLVGIDQKDVAEKLWKFILWSFSTIFVILSTIWIISLFRAIWTPKEQKRRRLLNWISTSIIAIIIFVLFLPFWFYVFKTINATDYDNLDGQVSVYDNDLYLHSESRDYSWIKTTNNLIWPITLRYDISGNAKAIAKKNLLEMEWYEINFDGATCVNEKSIMKWSNPLTEEWLICTFDQVRTYNIRWTYSVRDRLGESRTISIPLNAVEIKGNLEINTTTNKDKKRIITLSAAKIKNLGNPRWQYTDGDTVEKSQASITEELSSNPVLVCLKIFGASCDRYFIINDNEISWSDIVWSILFAQDSTNSLWVSMTLTGVNISNTQIINIDWIDNDNNRLCKWTNEKCDYTFTRYGNKIITATITLADKKTYNIEWKLQLNTPLLVTQHAKVFNQDNKLLNTNETFDAIIGGYVIKNIDVPTKLTFDARDIVIENSGYKIRNVTWKITHDKTTEEKVGEQVIYELPKTVRYTIEAIYTFEKISNASDTDNFIARDLIIIDLAREPLEAKLVINQSSNYTPAKITVDASTSQSKNGTIQKFIFDFGEWKPPAEGDAIQTYEYRTPGQKNIKLTIIDDKNEQASTSKYIILKETPKSIQFTTSMSPWVINMPVDFIADGTTGNIEEWIWNFWDNTPISKWYEVSHTYIQSGDYNVTMTVRYMDGTEKSTTKSFKVENTLE